MSDNKDIRDERDRQKIDANDPNEVEYVHRQFPDLTHQQVLEAVKAHGPDREKVMTFLRQQNGGRS